ncbi:MAG TPA: peptidylprolyl isomerase [Allocoleopsis sp.]
MNEFLQIGTLEIPTKDIIPLLAKYLMLPNLLKEIIIDKEIESIECTDTEIENAVKQFCAKNQLVSPTQLKEWLDFHGLNPDTFTLIATRDLKIEKFKQTTWSNKIESYFMTRKTQLDRIIYSLLRTSDMGIAQELYFRIQEGEQTFEEVARAYSQGPEKETGGLIGPVELSTLNPSIAKLLLANTPGQLCAPISLGEWVVIVRLEKFMPVQLDEQMRHRLLNEFFANWLQEEMQKVLPQSDKPLQ